MPKDTHTATALPTRMPASSPQSLSTNTPPRIDAAEWSRISVKLAPSQGFVRHPPGYAIPESWFKQSMLDYDFWLINSGDATLRGAQGESYPLRRGSVVLLRPHSVWSVQPSAQALEPLSMTWFHFDLIDTRSGKLLPTHHLDPIPTVMQCEDVEYTEIACRRILQITPFGGDSDATASSYQLAGELLKNLIRETYVRHRYTQRPADIDIPHDRYRQLVILRHDLQRDPSLFNSAEDMASRCKVSVDYFSRLFKRAFNKTPTDYIIATRIEKAKHMLLGTPYSVSQIAEQLGYDSVHFFSRQFKGRVGVSPLAFRRK